MTHPFSDKFFVQVEARHFVRVATNMRDERASCVQQWYNAANHQHAKAENVANIIHSKMFTSLSLLSVSLISSLGVYSCQQASGSKHARDDLFIIP